MKPFVMIALFLLCAPLAPVEAWALPTPKVKLKVGKKKPKKDEETAPKEEPEKIEDKEEADGWETPGPEAQLAHTPSPTPKTATPAKIEINALKNSWDQTVAYRWEKLDENQKKYLGDDDTNRSMKESRLRTIKHEVNNLWSFIERHPDFARFETSDVDHQKSKRDVALAWVTTQSNVLNLGSAITKLKKDWAWYQDRTSSGGFKGAMSHKRMLETIDAVLTVDANHPEALRIKGEVDKELSMLDAQKQAKLATVDFPRRTQLKKWAAIHPTIRRLVEAKFKGEKVLRISTHTTSEVRVQAFNLEETEIVPASVAVQQAKGCRVFEVSVSRKRPNQGRWSEWVFHSVGGNFEMLCENVNP